MEIPSYLANITPEDVWNALTFLTVMFSANFALRWLYEFIARLNGFWSPTQDNQWPRLPWRPVWRSYTKLKEFKEQVFRMGKGGSAGWTSFLSSLSLNYRSGDVLLGRAWTPFGAWPQVLGLRNVQRHQVLIGGAGSGKTAAMITMLALLTANQSAFVIDPKGQIAKIITEAQRALGRAVHVLDPLSITQFKTACWNCLAEIAAINARLGEDVTTLYLDKIASADIEKNAKENPFWPDSGRLVWAAVLAFVYICAYVYKTLPIEECNPITARSWVSEGLKEVAENGEDPMEFLWAAMASCEELGGYISKAGAMMLNADDRTGNNILATVRTSTKYYDHPQVRRVCQTSSFNLCDLKGGNDFVILAAPTTEIRGALSGWFRSMTMTSLWEFEQIAGGLSDPTLFMVDEFPALGYIEEIQQAAPVMRGYGVRLLIASQDLEGMQRVYPHGWGGLLGNAEAVYFMGVGHKQTADYIAERLGRAVHSEVVGNGEQAREYREERDVMTSDQVMRFLSPRRNNGIVLRFGERSLKIKLMPYYKGNLPVWLAAPDPEHGEPALRSRFRALFNALFRRAEPVRRVDMDEATARNIFGLHGTFTRHELAEREQLLKQRFAAELIADARAALDAAL